MTTMILMIFFPTVTTVISHDTPYIEMINFTSNTVVISVSYTVPQDQIEAVMKVSHMCRQYLKAHTRNVPMPLWSTPQGRYMNNFGIPTGLIGCFCNLKRGKISNVYFIFKVPFQKSRGVI